MKDDSSEWGHSGDLEMPLESGLYKLSGLSRMRELDVTSMHMEIDAKEVQWMAEHWPRLRALRYREERENSMAPGEPP